MSERPSEDFKAAMERLRIIRMAIIAEHKATGKNHGVIPCPACKTGKVEWSRATSNGHVWAQCSTPECAAWME
jgi:hypothetical protein